jgi:hypothetical protein
MTNDHAIRRGATTRRRWKSALATAGVLAALVIPPAAPAFAATGFRDIDASVHKVDILLLAGWGITKGCNPPVNDLYCPEEPVTRGQMAAFMKRSFLTPTSVYDYFVDDDSSVFEADINSITGVGITKGCNPPLSSEYCTDDEITRGQMAAFLVRTLSLPPGPDAFSDDGGSIFQGDINALAAAGVTKGCTDSDFCPDGLVTRAQMASFLVRALAELGCRSA